METTTTLLACGRCQTRYASGTASCPGCAAPTLLCGACHADNGFWAPSCRACGAMFDYRHQATPVAPPPAPAAPSHRAEYAPALDVPLSAPDEPDYAGFWLRVVARVIDFIVFLPVNAIIAGDPFANLKVSNPKWWALLLIEGLYFSALHSSPYQATIGKLVVGIKVTDEAGERIDLARAVWRYVAEVPSSLLLFVGFAMAGFTKRKQALHDKLAHTLVVRR